MITFDWEFRQGEGNRFYPDIKLRDFHDGLAEKVRMQYWSVSLPHAYV